MLSYTDLKPDTNFIKDGQPYNVLEYTHVKKQRGAPIVQLRVYNILNGKTKEMTVHQSQEFEEADVEEVPAEFIYYQDHHGEFWFKDLGDGRERFSLNKNLVSEKKSYLKPGLEVKLLKFKDDFVDINLPIKVDLKVTMAPPAVKGNTAEGGTKKLTVETGTKIDTPLFIEKGDVIRVNTETGKYTERIEKN